MNEVYVIAGGEWLSNNLNAIAAFMGTRTWDSIEKIALTLSVLAVAVMWVQRHNVMDLLGWVAVFVLISLLVNVRTSVQIIDNSDLVKVHRVDNVPVGLAMPLSLTTRIGHAMVASYEMIFTQPDSVTYSKTGMLFGAELVSKSTDFLSRNPEIANLFQDYVQNCVMGDIYLNHKYTLEELMASADPYTLIFSRPSPLRGVYDSNNNFVTCKDASVSLKDKLNLEDLESVSGAEEAAPQSSSTEGASIADTVQALVALGYSNGEAYRAVHSVPEAEKLDAEQLLKEALKKVLTFL